MDPLDKEVTLMRSTMETQMSRDFGCDLLVAKYALISVEYSGVPEAVEVIFGGSAEDGVPLKHPYFGYTPLDHVELES